MSYVQAAVYDDVTKISGRYMPYHDFTVAAATRRTLDYYLPDRQATVDAEYGPNLATLTGDVAGGVTVGKRHHRAPHR